MSKYGTTAKVVGWCEYDDNYSEFECEFHSIVVYTDLHEYYKIILKHCFWNYPLHTSIYSEMDLVLLDKDYPALYLDITHVPIKDYYIDLNLIENHNSDNYDGIFKCEVFEFSICEDYWRSNDKNVYKIYKEKFVKYSIGNFRDLIDFEKIIDNKKDIKEELLQVAFHPSRIEYYLEQGIKIGEFDKVI